MNRFTPVIMAFVTLFASASISQQANADDRVWRTSVSLVGESRYADPSKKHFDHVNPDAPKGGTINSAVQGSYDSFNPFIVRGEESAGINYQGGILWDLLMARGVDASSESHPLIAEAFTYPEDYSSATYRLNPKARWHDGKSITVEDVKWSMEMMKEHSPQYNQYFSNITEVRIDNDREITFLFDQKNNRELPIIIGDLPVQPKHWWEGTDANGKKRDFSQPTLEPPLGSGPYKIGKFKPGVFITWERVKDYWAADTLTRKGRFNADIRKYTYFKDSYAIWEAFKKGGFQDIRPENRSEYWARRYNFPALTAGDVKKEEFPDASGQPMQGFILNTRREVFKDRDVRKALVMAMNFQRMNQDLFFGLYTRTDSYFEGSELAATGLPQGRELEILEQFKDQLPADVFTEPYKLPVYKDRSDERRILRQAFDLLTKAGWTRKGRQLVNEKGQPFKLVVLGFSPSSERVNAPWISSLKKLGIDASFRVVDTAQFVQRVRNFNYDVTVYPVGQTNSPGNEQLEYWTSAAADKPGSRNYSGIKDPVVDKLVDMLIYAKDREELVTVTRALDRVLLKGYYIVPQWYNPNAWVAYWNKFEIPRPQPTYRGFDPESWWIDLAKEVALRKKYH